MPKSLYIRAMIRATEVFPVPGFPVKTRWYETCVSCNPLFFLACCTLMKLGSDLTSSFTGANPINDSNSLYGSSDEACVIVI